MSENTKRRKTKRRSHPLYHAAKISDYRFRKVLWHFVHDHTAAETARDVTLSTNSVQAIFRKIRVYFFEVGLFMDIYQGRDPIEVDTGNPHFEKLLIEFHFERMNTKKSMRQPITEPPYHFAESCWRYDFHVMMSERPDAGVYGMTERHLLELIRRCGPVGDLPRNRRAGLLLVMRQTDERIDWLRRNAPGFRAEHTRAELRAVRAVQPTGES